MQSLWPYYHFIHLLSILIQLKNSSRELATTYNSSIIAKDVTIVTKVTHCATLAADKVKRTLRIPHSSNIY